MDQTENPGLRQSFLALAELMRRLRDPVSGCPWDVAQTYETIAPYTIEEAYEVADAIGRKDVTHLREELGDLLFQVFFHSRIAEESGHFTLEEVVTGLVDKMTRRHPHVFGEQAKLGDSSAVLVEWDKIKAAEKAAAGKPAKRFKEAPPRLPSLHFARDVAKIAQKHSLDLTPFRDEARVSQLASNLSEETAGQALFELALACRKAGIDAEAALRRHAAKVVDHYETKE